MSALAEILSASFRSGPIVTPARGCSGTDQPQGRPVPLLRSINTPQPVLDSRP